MTGGGIPYGATGAIESYPFFLRNTFGTPDEGFAHEQVLEMIEVFGQQVIPEFDTDPEHSTTKYRRQAQRRFPTFNNSVDPIVDQATPPEFAISI